MIIRAFDLDMSQPYANSDLDIAIEYFKNIKDRIKTIPYLEIVKLFQTYGKIVDWIRISSEEDFEIFSSTLIDLDIMFQLLNRYNDTFVEYMIENDPSITLQRNAIEDIIDTLSEQTLMVPIMNYEDIANAIWSLMMYDNLTRFPSTTLLSPDLSIIIIQLKSEIFKYALCATKLDPDFPIKITEAYIAKLYEINEDENTPDELGEIAEEWLTTLEDENRVLFDNVYF